LLVQDLFRNSGRDSNRQDSTEEGHWLESMYLTAGLDQIPDQGRDSISSLMLLIREFEYSEKTLGDDMSKWQLRSGEIQTHLYGHALSQLSNEEIKSKLDLGPLPEEARKYARINAKQQTKFRELH